MNYFFRPQRKRVEAGLQPIVAAEAVTEVENPNNPRGKGGEDQDNFTVIEQTMDSNKVANSGINI